MIATFVSNWVLVPKISGAFSQYDGLIYPFWMNRSVFKILIEGLGFLKCAEI